ncbi:DUF4173 domain-containing protein [Nonomuraea sp. SMC257]|uniref:Signal transduction histidine-protein kinase/phosphatase MprB n=1 Tax=Nonomuraea montanisoli TaxID=2741721 RepID=A0A7Y6M126_9ACTN|nr:DUF4153 domain-containing protein [Nonomuraea montanisoli]NUW29986.1 DUF4173 domain-containing protein [Nonomuraea montanisoli]
MRPLDSLGRIKVKLGIVIVLAVGTAFVVNEVGINSGLSRELRIAVAVALALIMVQVLAMGMTRPLREMARAAQTVAKGRYDLRVRATSRDEVGELARAFNAMAADLGEVDRQRRELVANVSHELRTPITALRAVLENVVDGVSAADPGTMSTALAQTERLGRLVAQLLDLSRLDSGVRLIEAEPVELAPLLEQAVREAELAREDVRIVARAPGGLVVRADPDLLAQVLANLLDNAVRHSPPGGVVTVAGAAEGDGARLTVADQGPGIPASARSRVFERFSRLDAARAADAGGAGLGLAIVKEIVELHGGGIRIGDGTGCRMIIDLPGRTAMGDRRGAAPPPDREERPASGDAIAPEATGPALGDGVRPAAALPGPAEETAVEPVPEGKPGPASEGALPVPPAGAGTGAPEPVHAGRPSGEAPVPAPAYAAAPGPAAPYSGVSGHGAPYSGVSGHDAPYSGVSGPGASGPGASGPGSVARPAIAAAYAAPPVPGPGDVLLRLIVGTGLGLVAGFAVGVVAAVFVSFALGDGFGLIALVLCTLLAGALGAIKGASPRRAPARPFGPAGPGQGGGQEGGQVPPPVYVPPPLFPRPELPGTPRWLLPAAAGTGVFGAVALPGAQAGLGVVLVALVLGAAALPAVLRRLTPWTCAYALVAYVLISMAVLRDADWLVGVLLVAGAALAALAVSGAGLGWIGAIRGVLSVLLALPPVPWFLAEPLKRLTARRRILPVLAGLGITAVLVAVFGVLFASADRVFASYVRRLTATPEWAETLPLRVFVFAVVAVLLAAVVLVALRPVNDPAGPEVKLTVSRSVWLLPLTAVNLLFAAFVAVQITALFGGNAWVLRTAGLTYAEYAREGFFQLVVVSVFVLGIVAVAAGVLRVGRRERWLLAGQLGVLCALTLVVLASALHRLSLYTDAYGLSRLRLSVQATLWWLAAVFALVLLAGAVRLAGRGAAWLPRTVVLVTGVALVGFAVVNPDLRVAQTQVAVRGVAKMDSDYLGDLGAEAVPALDRLPEPQRSCVLADVVAANDLGDADPWNGWNLARAQARAVLAEHPIRPGASCPRAASRTLD